MSGLLTAPRRWATRRSATHRYAPHRSFRPGKLDRKAQFIATLRIAPRRTAAHRFAAHRTASTFRPRKLGREDQPPQGCAPRRRATLLAALLSGAAPSTAPHRPAPLRIELRRFGPPAQVPRGERSTPCIASPTVALHRTAPTSRPGKLGREAKPPLRAAPQCAAAHHAAPLRTAPHRLFGAEICLSK